MKNVSILYHLHAICITIFSYMLKLYTLKRSKEMLTGYRFRNFIRHCYNSYRSSFLEKAVIERNGSHALLTIWRSEQRGAGALTQKHDPSMASSMATMEY